MTLPLWFVGALILAAAIMLVAVVFGGPSLPEEIYTERERKREILASCAARKNRRVDVLRGGLGAGQTTMKSPNAGSNPAPATNIRLARALIGDPDREGK